MTPLLGYFENPNMQFVCFGAKYIAKDKAILAYNTNPATLMQIF